MTDRKIPKKILRTIAKYKENPYNFNSFHPTFAHVVRWSKRKYNGIDKYYVTVKVGRNTVDPTGAWTSVGVLVFSNDLILLDINPKHGLTSWGGRFGGYEGSPARISFRKCFVHLVNT